MRGNTYSSLNTNRASKLAYQVLVFINEISGKRTITINEGIVMNHIQKFYSLIQFQCTKHRDFKITAKIGPKHNYEEIDILDRSEMSINTLFREYKQYLSQDGLDSLVILSNNIMRIKDVDLFHKTNIIDAENSLLNREIDLFIENGNEKTVKEFLDIRIELLLDCIHDFEIVIKGNIHFNQDIQIIYNLYNKYLGLYIDSYLIRNQILQAYGYLKNELEENEDEKVIKILLNRIVDINSKFLLEPPADVEFLLDEHSLLFSEEFLSFLKASLNTDPRNIIVNNIKLTHGCINTDVVSNKRIITNIRFSIPFASKISQGHIHIDNFSHLDYKEINNPFSDPIYKFYKEYSIGGVGFNYFTDNCNMQKSIALGFVIDEFYHPDKELNGNDYVEVDNSEKEALIGRDYHPYKERIVKTLLDNYSEVSKYLHIEKKDININLFSNYVVEYIDFPKNTLLYRKLYLQTNPDSYSKVSDRFIERLNEINLSDSRLSIRDILDKSNIVSEKSLSLYIQHLINVVVKDSVEEQGNHKCFWKANKAGNRVPNREPDMQPIILGYLKPLLDYSGIQISREVISANGAVDYLCSYTYHGKVLRICVELKNAHGNIKSGLTMQLPAYLKCEKSRYGIFLVLWYKGDDFREPKEYDNIDKLSESLNKLSCKAHGYKSDVIIIDCTKPIVPSKLKYQRN